MAQFLRRHQRLIAVVLFLALLLAVFELSGVRGHFNLAFVQQQIQAHRVTGLLVFILLFSLGNLIQIPGWLFLAAAVLTLGRGWGGVATYAAASISCVVTFLVIRFIGGNALRELKSKTAQRLLGRGAGAGAASVADAGASGGAISRGAGASYYAGRATGAAGRAGAAAAGAVADVGAAGGHSAMNGGRWAYQRVAQLGNFKK